MIKCYLVNDKKLVRKGNRSLSLNGHMLHIMYPHPTTDPS